MWNSSNPALTHFDAFPADRSVDQATLGGVLNKTALLVTLAGLAGCGGYTLVTAMPSLMWISGIASLLVCLGIGFVLKGNPALAPAIAWLYAIVEGVFLGCFTKILDGIVTGMLASKVGTEASLLSGGLALPALIITFGIGATMFMLYRTQIIRPTQTFKAVVMTATIGIGVSYLIGFVLSLFGVSIPFIGLSSAMSGGTAALVGLGFSAVVLIIASLNLVLDFERVDEIVSAGSPRAMEWYGAFALLVTLAWIYYEAVKMLFRIAALLRRD